MNQCGYLRHTIRVKTKTVQKHIVVLVYQIIDWQSGVCNNQVYNAIDIGVSAETVHEL